MNSKKNKWLTTSLKVSLYVILATGTVFALAIYGIIPPVLVNGAKILIALHKILGYIFLGLILCHALSYRKWYKVWFSGKMKNKKKSLLTKSISILFILLTCSLFFEEILPHGVYIWGHIIIGTTWIVLMIQHFSVKKRFHKKEIKYLPEQIAIVLDGNVTRL